MQHDLLKVMESILFIVVKIPLKKNTILYCTLYFSSEHSFKTWNDRHVFTRIDGVYSLINDDETFQLYHGSLFRPFTIPRFYFPLKTIL